MSLTLKPETEARLLSVAAQRQLPPEETLDVLLAEADTERIPAEIQMPEIASSAKRLAALNRESAPETEVIYWFPAADEIRFIETDPNMLPSERIEQYYFGRDTRSGIFFRYAIALVRPEEAGQLPPPPGWGEWNNAITL